MRSAIFYAVSCCLAGNAFAGRACAQDQSAAPDDPSSPRLDDPLLGTPPAPRMIIHSWEEALAIVRAESPDLRTALTRIAQSRATTWSAVAQYLPSLSANAGYAYELITRVDATGSVVSAGGLVATTTVPVRATAWGAAQLQQTLLNLQAADQIGIATLGEDATHLSLLEVKRGLSLRLANRIAQVVTAERVAEIHRFGLRVALAQSELVTRKEALGGATELDVVRFQQNVEIARTAVVLGDESLRQGREDLGAALGNFVETGVAPEVSLNGIGAAAVNWCPSVSSVELRPDVERARKNVEIARRNVSNIDLGWSPTVVVQSAVSATTLVASGYPNPTWDVQALLSVPLWDGGSRAAARRFASAAADLAEEEKALASKQAVAESDHARRQLEVAERIESQARAERDLAASNERLTTAAYVAGRATSLELIVAAEAHRQAEVELAVAELAIVKARILATLTLGACGW
jgi:multidrug efflux system outer membrane protein